MVVDVAVVRGARKMTDEQLERARKLAMAHCMDEARSDDYRERAAEILTSLNVEWRRRRRVQKERGE